MGLIRVESRWLFRLLQLLFDWLAGVKFQAAVVKERVLAGSEREITKEQLENFMQLINWGRSVSPLYNSLRRSAIVTWQDLAERVNRCGGDEKALGIKNLGWETMKALVDYGLVQGWLWEETA